MYTQGVQVKHKDVNTQVYTAINIDNLVVRTLYIMYSVLLAS